VRKRAWCANPLFLSAFAAGAVTTASAQIVLDGKFGASGALTGPNYSIPAEVGATRGNNLFHSFSQFNLATGDAAAFSGPANIQNILARVTGGSSSSIDGTIRSEIPGANLFLINPNGIIFGPNAAIDVSGSFAASTANYLKLADGARFVASLDADDSGLSTAPVSAFGFLGGSAASIKMDQTKLSVADGREISVVAGEVLMNGAELKAAGGRINAVSTQVAGEVPVDAFAALPGGGVIDLKNNSHIDASGEGGGRVVIRGGRLVVDTSKIEANSLGTGEGKGIDIAVTGDITLLTGGQINSLSPAGLGNGGNIKITSAAIDMDGGGLTDDFFNPTTGISAATGEPFIGGGTAKGGDVSIRTGRLEMVNAAQISSASYGNGDAGRIEIDAESVRLDAQFLIAQITANSQPPDQAGGKGGDIVIRTGSFDLENGATVLAASFGAGPGGTIDLTAKTVKLGYGGVIVAGAFGAGPGGNIQVTADTLKIDGRNYATGDEGAGGIQAITTSGGDPAPGGKIQIKAGSLEVVNGGTIFTSSFGLGQGGDISISAGSIHLDNAGNIRSTGEMTGAAGTITVETTGPISLTKHSSLATSAPASSGGNIVVRGGSDINLDNSEFTAQAGLNGGNITVTAPHLVYLLQSKITGQADSTGTGFGNGGNLTFDSGFLVMNDGALISKSSFGNGGNITILSDFFFPSSSIIDASAPFGLPGTVSVTAPEVDLSGVLAILPANFIDASALLRPDCGVRLGGNISSFLVMPRGGLPIAPGGFVPSSAPGEKDETK
jgi:filamentous hemagglutinin family protein